MYLHTKKTFGRKLFFALYLLFFLPLSSFSIKSDDIKISVITCGPGEELYSAFGHTAIRISDKNKSFDYVFNYGTFDFNTSNFYLKFAKGKLDYMLSVSPYYYFIEEYQRTQRWLLEQELNLSPVQKQAMYDFLTNNARPENKFYRYDFFFDNCATRIKDVLKSTLQDSLILGNSEIENRTFRELYTNYLDNNKWGRFGINLGLGQLTDRIVTNEESSYIPDYLYRIIKNSKIKSGNQEIPLVLSENFIYKPDTEKTFEKTKFSPSFVFWSILLIVILIIVFELVKKTHLYIVDKFIFFSLGILGIFLLLLWTATDHTTVVKNWNLLWAIPLHIVPAFLLNPKRKPFLKFYFLTNSAIAFLTIVTWNIIPQGYDIAFIPILLIIFSRSLKIVHTTYSQVPE